MTVSLLAVDAWVIFVGLGAALVFLIALLMLLQRYQKVGPNEVLIVSGMGCSTTMPDGKVRAGIRLRKGGGTFVWPVINRAQLLSLEIMTIDVKTPEVQSVTGMPIIVEGVAQIKVKGTDVAIMTAAEMFLDKTDVEIMRVAHQTLEGHLRAIVGQMDPVALFRERETFAQEVQKISATDFANMGLEVVSFTMKEVKDNMGFYEMMAQAPKAEMDRDTAIKKAFAERDSAIQQADASRETQIRQAEAERDAKIRTAEARRAGEEARYANEAVVKKSERDYNINAARYRAESEREQAIAGRAAEIEDQKQLQMKKSEETKLAGLEVARRESDLNANVREPARAERDRVIFAAEAQRNQIEAEALGRSNAERALGEGQADAIRARGLAEAEIRKAQGLAEADVVLAKGQAEATAMSKKAEAWKGYNEAAVAEMFIDKLPAVAEAVARPLAQVEKIIMISNGGSDGVGASRLSKEIIDIVAQLPPILEGVSGLNIKDLVQNLPKIGKGEKKA